MHKVKIIFFQPYIANWREEFLIRFKENTLNEYEVEILTGYHDKQKSNNSKRVVSNIADKILYSLNKNVSFKKQNYPIYFSPGLLFELIKRKPDVVITEGEINFFNNILIALYSLIFRKRYLWWSLGKVRNRKVNLINKVFSIPMTFLIKQSSYILARNTLAKEYYLKKGYKNNKIVLVPNSMDDRKIKKLQSQNNQFNMNTNNVLFIGSLIKEKKVDQLIYVINDLKEVIPDINLTIVGEGEEYNRLKKLTNDLKINNYVTFVGAVYDDVSQYFYKSNLVVLPGMGGLSIQHAMLHARPVVCTIADGIEHDLVINNETGFIIKANHKKEMYNSINNLLKDKNKTKTMGERAFKHVNENWNMNLMISKMKYAIEESDPNKKHS